MDDDTKPHDSSTLKDANRSIRFHSIGAAAALLLPVPLLDAALLIGIQVNLVRSLAKIYDMPFSEEVGKSLVSALIGSSVSGAAWSLTKLIPIVGVVGASAAGAASTYAVGKVFVQHFESGGTFLTFDPSKVKAYYEQELSKGTVKGSTSQYNEEEDFGGIKP
jgi:uncharacterized protein (DUF697 family)